MKIKNKIFIIFLIILIALLTTSIVNATELNNQTRNDNQENILIQNDITENQQIQENTQAEVNSIKTENNAIIKEQEKTLKKDETLQQDTTISLVDTHDDENDGIIHITNNDYGILEFNVQTTDESIVNQGTVTLRDNKKKVVDTIDLSTGNNTFIINSLAIDFQASTTLTYYLNYTGNEYYKNANTQVTLKLSREESVNTILTVTATDTEVNNKTYITVKLTSEDGRPIIKEKVLLHITDKTQTVTTNASGMYQYKSFSYPLEGTIEIQAEYQGSTTKLYNPSNDNTTFTVSKKTVLSNDTSTWVVYLDKNDENNDYLLDIYTDKINLIEFIVVDTNGEEIKTDNATLYLQSSDNLTYDGQVISSLMGIMDAVDVIDLTTDNRTFIFNPLAYNITKDLNTTFTIYYPNTDEHSQALASIKTYIHFIEDIQTDINIDSNDVYIGEDSNITITLTANNITIANQDLKITIDNNTLIKTTDENGQVIIDDYNTTTATSIPITVEYDGNTSKGLLNTSNTSSYNVNKIPTSIIVNNINQSNFTVTVQELDEETLVNQGNITLEIDGIGDITEQLQDEIYEFSLNLLPGTYDINITYNGNDRYQQSKTNLTLTIEPIQEETIITIIDTHDDEENNKIRITNEEIGVIEFNIKTSNNQTVENGSVRLYNMNKKEIGQIDLTTGNNTFYINSLAEDFKASKAGYYTLEYTGNEYYKDSTTKVLVSLVRSEYIQTKLTVNATDTIVNENTLITAKLTSQDGRPIAYETIILHITDKSYPIKTNEEGIAQYKMFSYPLNTTIEVQAEYTGNNTKLYLPSNNNTTFQVSKPTTPTNDTYTSTVYLDNNDGRKDYLLDIYSDRLNLIEFIVVDSNADSIDKSIATLYLQHEDDIAGSQQIIGSIAGVLDAIDTIDLTTNNRTFIFNPSLYNLKDNLETKFTIHFAAVENYTQSLATIKTTLHIVEVPTIMDLQATNTVYENNATINVTLSTSNYKLAYQQVNISIDGNSNIYTTDENGQILINYTDTPKDNIQVTAQYNGNTAKGYKSSTNTTTFNITRHNTTTMIEATNITPDATTLTITVTDENNNTVNTSTITIKTDDINITLPLTDGQIKTVIPAMPGEHNITVTYNMDDKYNNSTATTTINNPKHNTTITTDSQTKIFAGTNNVTITLTDEQSNPITNAQLQITSNNKTTINTKTDNAGKINITLDFNAGINNITIKYDGNENYTSATRNITINASTLATTVTVENVISTVAENMTLTAYVTDQLGRPAESGKLIFKVNGQTLKINGITGGNTSNLEVQVINGTATTTIEASLYLRHAQNITAVYAGTSRYYANTSQTAGKMSIRLRNASIVVTTKEVTNQDTNLLLMAHVYDVTNGKKTTLKDYDDNYVIFKVNGITIKDASGNALKAKVINGVAQLNYTVPIGLAGIYINKTDKLYTVEAVFASAEYYPNARNTTVFKVNRSEVSFNDMAVVLNNNTRVVTITASLQDYHTNMLRGQNNIIVKINGLTFQENGQNKYFTSTGGVVNITFTLPDNVKSLREIQLVTTERVGYLGGRNTTSIIETI